MEDGFALAMFWDGRTQVARRQWVTKFVDSLEAAGHAGVLGGPPLRVPEKLPGLMEFEGYIPTAFLGVRLGEHLPLNSRLTGWMATREDTGVVAQRAAAWANDEPKMDCWLALANMVEVVDTEPTNFLTHAAGLCQTGIGLTYESQRQERLNHVSLADRGQLVLQTLARSTDWRAEVERATHALLLAPELVDVGLVKYSVPRASSWGEVVIPAHKPCLYPMDYTNHRHLWDRFVIDAHGVSLLTGSHLERANDLSGWLVESVAPDRYLVSSRDLAAWYASPGPDPALLEKARADFGDMILTWERMAEEPGPYTNLELYGRRP